MTRYYTNGTASLADCCTHTHTNTHAQTHTHMAKCKSAAQNRDRISRLVTLLKRQHRTENKENLGSSHSRHSFQNECNNVVIIQLCRRRVLSTRRGRDMYIETRTAARCCFQRPMPRRTAKTNALSWPGAQLETNSEGCTIAVFLPSSQE